MTNTVHLSIIVGHDGSLFVGLFPRWKDLGVYFKLLDWSSVLTLAEVVKPDCMTIKLSQTLKEIQSLPVVSLTV